MNRYIPTGERTESLKEFNPDLDMHRHPYDQFSVVDMSDGKHSKHGLLTRSLNGCTGLIASSKEDYKRHGIMTHFYTNEINANLKTIVKLFNENEEMIYGDIGILIFYPRILKESADKLAVGTLNMIGKNMRGEKPKLKKIPYEMEGDIGVILNRTGSQGVLVFDAVTGEYNYEPISHSFNSDHRGYIDMIE